jgi:predicted nucleic acid-binding Zn finger protein
MAPPKVCSWRRIALFLYRISINFFNRQEDNSLKEIGFIDPINSFKHFLTIFSRSDSYCMARSRARRIGREERAQKLVDELRVKRHLFAPSGRQIWSIVGNEGDFYATFPFDDAKQSFPEFCSCDDFHYRALNGEIAECYHLIAGKKAFQQKKYSTVEFSDEDYESFLRSLLHDIFSRYRESAGGTSQSDKKNQLEAIS